MWGQDLSKPFTVSNGVRQGGILSPLLFNVYVDCLSVRLRSMTVGCTMNSVCFNHLVYADDTVLLAPSPKALQSLINICSEFGKEYDIMFNAKKTKSLCIKPDLLKNLYVPRFYLNELLICDVDEESYLGFIVNKHFTDDDHICKEMRSLYARGIMLIRNFKHCTDDVKAKLYKSFCCSIYCCPLWHTFKSSSLKKIHVASNKVFKSLMDVPRDFSASLLFVQSRVDNFSVLRRKLIYSLYTRVTNSANMLVSTIVLSSFFKTSLIHKQWKMVLH